MFLLAEESGSLAASKMQMIREKKEDKRVWTSIMCRGVRFVAGKKQVYEKIYMVKL